MSLFKRFLRGSQDSGDLKNATPPPGMQTMGASLQRKFAKGVQYNSMYEIVFIYLISCLIFAQDFFMFFAVFDQ